MQTEILLSTTVSSVLHPSEKLGQRPLRIPSAEAVSPSHILGIPRQTPHGNRSFGPDRKDAPLFHALVDEALRRLVDLGTLLKALHELRILPVPPLRRPGVAVAHGVLSRVRLNHDVSRVAHALEGRERNAVGAAPVQKLHSPEIHDGRNVGQGGRRAQPVDVVREVRKAQVLGLPRLDVRSAGVEIDAGMLKGFLVEGNDAVRDVVVAKLRVDEVSRPHPAPETPEALVRGKARVDFETSPLLARDEGRAVDRPHRNADYAFDRQLLVDQDVEDARRVVRAKAAAFEYEAETIGERGRHEKESKENTGKKRPPEKPPTAPKACKTVYAKKPRRP